MDKALENAIYYINFSDNNRYKIIDTLYYDGTETCFKKIIGSFRENINIKNFFKRFEHIFYKICDGIANNYKRLLIKNIDRLIIITREDHVIVINSDNSNNSDNNNIDDDHYDNNNDNNNDYDNNNKYPSEHIRVGIIKIDAVIAELNSSNRGNNTIWPSLFIFVAGLLVGSYILGDAIDNFIPKSD